MSFGIAGTVRDCLLRGICCGIEIHDLYSRTRNVCIVFASIGDINFDQMCVDGIGFIAQTLPVVNLCKPTVDEDVIGVECLCFQKDFNRISDVAQLEIHLGKLLLLREGISSGKS